MNAQPLLSFDASGAQFAWDATSLTRADTCQRKYYYEAIEGYRSHFESVHLWFGGHYATALEHYHKHIAAGMEREEAIFAIVREALINTWDHDLDEQGEFILGTGKARTFDHASKSRETLIRTIVWYFDHFADDMFSTYITAEGRPAVEHSFSLPADNGIILCGHIDRLCLDNEHNIYVHDQKTTQSTISPYFFKSYKPSHQFSLYTFAGKVIYDAPVRGIILDAAQVVVGFTRFGRAPIPFTDGELNEWYDESMALIERTRQNTLNRHFPRNPTACSNYGGCVFREVCARPLEVRENFLKGDFVKGPQWDPLQRR